MLSANPGAVHDRAPTLGEHTDTVLREAGMDDARRAALRAAGVIG
jgi:formyl-CoA transferase